MRRLIAYFKDLHQQIENDRIQRCLDALADE